MAENFFHRDEERERERVASDLQAAMAKLPKKPMLSTGVNPFSGKHNSGTKNKKTCLVRKINNSSCSLVHCSIFCHSFKIWKFIKYQKCSCSVRKFD